MLHYSRVTLKISLEKTRKTFNCLCKVTFYIFYSHAKSICEHCMCNVNDCFPTTSIASIFFNCVISPSLSHAPTEPPDCPTDLKTIDIDSRTVTVTWSHPFSGNAPLSNYIIEYRVLDTDLSVSAPSSSSPSMSPLLKGAKRDMHTASDVKTDTTISENESTSLNKQTFKEMIESKLNSYRIQRLHPHTVYQVRVFAQNALGISSECSPITVTTEREAPAFPPR